MLERMRFAQGTWVGKAVMALLFVLIIVGLSFFGFADLFRNATTRWVARVGGSDISVDAFRDAYQTNLQQLQQRLRRPVTTAQARQFGLDRQVLSRLISDAVLDDQAHRLGLAISDQQIARAITDDPTFAGTNGQFDRARFTALLRNNGMTEQSFVRDQRATYLRQEVVDAVAGAINVPKVAVEALHRLQTETRSVDFVVLPPSLVTDVPTPDSAALQAYYDAHKQAFQSPEYRDLVILATSPATVAKPGDVTDADIKAAYNAAPAARFGTPERRTVQQIVFPTEDDAKAALDRIKGGTSFADIAAERHLSGKDLDLGTVTRADLFDKAIADAAFSLPANGTSDPIKTPFGATLVHVAAIEPGNRQPLADVMDLLRNEIAMSPAKTREALRSLRDKIEDSRASGKSLSEAAKDAGLDIRTVTIDATGHDRAGKLVDLPDSEAVIRAAFASDVGVDNDVIQSRQGDQLWFEVSKIDPAHQRGLDEVKAEVETAWRKEETEKRLSAKADELQKTLDGGATMEQVAASLPNVTVQHAADVKRSGGTGVSPTMAAKVFDTSINKSASVEAPDGSRIVFKMLDSAVPPLDADATDTKQIEDQYRTLFADALLTAYLNRVEGGNVQVNPDALATAMGGAS